MKLRSHRLRGGVLALPVLLLGGVLPSAGVATAAPAAPATPTAPVETGPPPRIDLVVDFSGSMTRNDAGGQTRLAAAKQAVTRIIDTVPQDAELGLRVYGATYDGEDKAKGCADTQQLLPVGKLDAAARTQVKTKVAGLNALGFTPIGVALNAAADDLGTTGKRRIVLVSDGEETCAPPPPCDVARNLKAKGVDLAVDVVGFKTDAVANAQLKCIAEVTGGTYVTADDADALTGSLSTLFRRAWTTYQATGTPVQGSLTGCADAPVVTPGQYLDKLAGGRDRYYRVKKRPDQILQVSATAIAEQGYDHGSILVVQAGPAGDGKPDGWLREFKQSVGWSNIITTGARSKTDTPGKDQPDDDMGCILVENKITDDGDADLPLELLIGLADADKPGVPQDTPVKTGPDATGGFSFNSATPIGPGTYRQSIAVGEAPFWRVDVKAGQQLKIKAGVEIPVEFPNDTLTGWSVAVYNATRNPATCEKGNHDATKLFSGGTGRFEWVCGPWDITRPDPKKSTSDPDGYAMPGTYYIQVQVAKAVEKAKGLIVPIDLAVEIGGTPLSGGDVVFDFGSTAPVTTAAAGSGNGGQNAPKSGEDIAGTKTSGDGGDSTVRKMALPVGIVLAVALLGGAGFYGLRRR